MPQNRVFSDVALACKKAVELIVSGALIRQPSLAGRSLRKARWLMFKHFGTQELTLPLLQDLKLRVSTLDNIVACDVYLDGHFAYEEFARTLHALGAIYGSDVRPTFIDVGANIGTHSLYALGSGRFKRVVSLEPQQRNFDYLRTNLQLNGFDTSDARKIGLSDRPSRVVLSSSSDNFGDNRIVDADDEYARRLREQAFTSEEVMVTDFASLTAELKLDTQSLFFWIDTQGHEYEVLSGIGPAVLESSAFVLEFWPTVLHERGKLSGLVELLLETTAEYEILQTQDGRRPIRSLGALSDELRAKPHPEDVVDLLCIGKRLHRGQ